MAEFTFNCPLCTMPMNAEEQYRGHMVPCPQCNENILIPEFAIEAGMQIGGYVMERMLGVGGMGEVWLAHQTAMSRKVALKLLSPSLTKNTEFVNQFMREVKMTGRLEHPNVITAFDAGVDNGMYYLAIAFVDGEELEDKLEREGRIPEKEALKIALAVAKALNYSWQEAKILHRDVKPANIMVEKTGVVKLMDMGISKSVTEDASITQSGTIVGTPHYISPEQAQAVSDLDFRTDVYSLGATLFHMATGEVPFDADNPMGVLTKHITEKLPDPRGVYPELSDQCSKLIQILMRKDRDARQQSWDEVEKDIRLVLKGNYPSSVKDGNVMQTVKVRRSGKSFSSSRANVQVQKVSRAPLFITLFLVLAAAGGGTYYVLEKKAEREAIADAQREAKNTEIRNKNELLADDRLDRVNKSKQLGTIWAEVTASIKKLALPADFVRAEAALNKVMSVETSNKKLEYAKDLLVKVEQRRLGRINEVMIALNSKAAELARESATAQEGYAQIEVLYNEYTGSYSTETAVQRSAMLEKYADKVTSSSQTHSVASTVDKLDVYTQICTFVGQGNFSEALDYIENADIKIPGKLTKLVKALVDTPDTIIAGLGAFKGAPIEIEGQKYAVDSVSYKAVKVSYSTKISGKEIMSKKDFALKDFPVDKLPLSIRYKVLLKSDADLANVYVAVALKEAGKLEKANEYLAKVNFTLIKNRLKQIFRKG